MYLWRILFYKENYLMENLEKQIEKKKAKPSSKYQQKKHILFYVRTSKYIFIYI